MADFGGVPASPPATSTLGHLEIARREITAWIDAGLSDFPVAAPGAVSTPTIDPAGGFYIDSVDVTMSTATPDATLRFTIDGSTPTEASPVYTAPVTLTA